MPKSNRNGKHIVRRGRATGVQTFLIFGNVSKIPRRKVAKSEKLRAGLRPAKLHCEKTSGERTGEKGGASIVDSPSAPPQSSFPS